MKIKIKAIVAAILLLAVVFCMTACNNKSEKTINVGCFPNITHSQALFEMSQTDFDKIFSDDIMLKWYQFNAGPSEMESFRAGKLDIGYIGPIPAITGYLASDKNIRIIAGVTNAGSILVTRNDLDIDSIYDLGGKTIAVPQFGNTQDILLRMVLEEAGLKSKENGGDVTIIQQANANIKVLLEKKQIDAALVPEPWGSRLEEEADAKVLLDYNEIFGGNYAVAVVVARKDYLDANRDTVKEFLKAHILATEEINGNISSASDKINSSIKKLSGVELEKSILDAAFGRLEVNYLLNRDSIADFARICKQLGVINEDVNAEDIIDLSVLEEALKELGR